MSVSLRPAFLAPSSMAGTITSRVYLGVLNGCMRMPSQSSPTRRQLYLLTAEMYIGRLPPSGLGPGLKKGGMRGNWYHLPWKLGRSLVWQGVGIGLWGG